MIRNLFTVIFISVLIFLAGCGKGNEPRPEDLKMTFEEFSVAYEKKVEENLMSEWSLKNSQKTNISDGQMAFYIDGVALAFTINSKTKNLDNIVVGIDKLTDTEKAKQAVVFSLVARVFSKNIESKEFISSVLKNIYDGRAFSDGDIGYVLSKPDNHTFIMIVPAALLPD